MHFICILENLIAKSGLTKKDFLIAVGLGKNNFNNWKNQHTIPSGDTLAVIADYFNCSVDYLLGRSDNPTPGGEISEDEKKLLSAYRKHPEMQGAVKRLLNIDESSGKKPITKIYAADGEDDIVRSAAYGGNIADDDSDNDTTY